MIFATYAARWIQENLIDCNLELLKLDAHLWIYFRSGPETFENEVFHQITPPELGVMTSQTASQTTS